MDLIKRIHRHSAPEEKVALFRSLFRGRDDVYPRRFESRKTGKSGYAPACGNEWLKGICEKPKIKCAECSHRRFLPVTDEVIRWHLSGQDGNGWNFTIGVYFDAPGRDMFFRRWLASERVAPRRSPMEEPIFLYCAEARP